MDHCFWKRYFTTRQKAACESHDDVKKVDARRSGKNIDVYTSPYFSTEQQQHPLSSPNEQQTTLSFEFPLQIPDILDPLNTINENYITQLQRINDLKILHTELMEHKNLYQSCQVNNTTGEEHNEQYENFPLDLPILSKTSHNNLNTKEQMQNILEHHHYIDTSSRLPRKKTQNYALDHKVLNETNDSCDNEEDVDNEDDDESLAHSPTSSDETDINYIHERPTDRLTYPSVCDCKSQYDDAHDYHFTPNPEKVIEIRQHMDSLAQKLVELRKNTKSQENKKHRKQVSSRISQLRKNLMYEENKIKYRGLKVEKDRLHYYINKTKKFMTAKNISRVEREYLIQKINMTLNDRVAGNFETFVESVIQQKSRSQQK